MMYLHTMILNNKHSSMYHIFTLVKNHKIIIIFQNYTMTEKIIIMLLYNIGGMHLTKQV